MNHTFFCGDCGSPLYGQPDSMPDMMSIKAESLDGGAARLEGGKIDSEAFTEACGLSGVHYWGEPEGMIRQ